MSTHTKELEAYGAYCEYCLRVGVQAMALDKWRNVSAVVAPMRHASPLMHGNFHTTGFSIINPQTRILVVG